jgi:hypothetical protein
MCWELRDGAQRCLTLHLLLNGRTLMFAATICAVLLRALTPLSIWLG